MRKTLRSLCHWGNASRVLYFINNYVGGGSAGVATPQKPVIEAASLNFKVIQFRISTSYTGWLETQTPGTNNKVVTRTFLLIFRESHRKEGAVFQKISRVVC